MHAAEHLRSAQYGGADVGIVAGTKNFHRLDERFFVSHTADRLKPGIVADHLVKGNQSYVISFFGQKTKKKSERVETQTIRVRSHAVNVAKAPAFVHNQRYIIAVCQRNVLLCVGCPWPAAHQCEGEDKGEKGREKSLKFFHGMPCPPFQLSY